MAITEGLLRQDANDADLARLAAHCADLARDGVDFLLVREKQLPPLALELATQRIVQQVRGLGMRVILAGPPELALSAGADGVYLSGGRRVAEARAVFPAAWVSVSCHTLDEVRRAREEAADAVVFAPVFNKTVDGVEVVRGVGLETLGEACRAAGAVPVFALGGVDEMNAAECFRVGAAGVAGIRMFFRHTHRNHAVAS